ncbi:ImmA/IrrE family metallo-endopeptidase [Cellulomonas denverensis]|uniref:ImmA/IrrE family metallo-endopeptidase n=1 Tax=Cellulomonas denverensis TaxID=264297 RepID=A0A7X6QZR8_9CELL|nr:ImmA/IrrE family metallo-endopeptidase [Cellulomonas denverensis]NKY23498.1 ImmA/IrrE family metallo-endopeptidase [Cellulomonas denverensis]
MRIAPEHDGGPIALRIDGAEVPLDRTTFTALFDSSVVYAYAPYRHALEDSTIGFRDFIGLARRAEIPYPLFFAPTEVVTAQLEAKTRKLLAGVSKSSFSLTSRSAVRLRDVELIVKDILRKQAAIKGLDASLGPNRVINRLRRSAGSVHEDADKVRSLLGLNLVELRTRTTNQKALEFLIERLEANQIFVSRSQQSVMPQRLPRDVSFSGLCVRDRKVPFIFLTSGEHGSDLEPAGRKIFTLVLLSIFIARGRFAPVSYEDQTGNGVEDRDYELAEEVLMPASDFSSFAVDALDDVKDAARRLHVTPSAFVMRARRLGAISPGESRDYLDELAEQFAARSKSPARTPLTHNAVRSYAGAEFTRRMLNQLDRGTITPGEFCRVVCLNRLRPNDLHLLRAAK